MSTLKVDTITKADGTNSISQDAIITTSSPQLGRRNLIINGAMQVWQRGTTVSSYGYAADRWYLSSSGATATMSQQSFAVEQEDVPFNPQYYLNLNVTTGNDNCGIHYKHEGTHEFDNKTLTLSFYAKSSNARELTVQFQTVANGATEIVNHTVTSSTFTPTSSWQRYTFELTAADMSGVRAYADNDYTRIMINQGSDTSTSAWQLDITGVQLEVGSVATPFEHRSYGEELALCQRYYEQVATNGEGSVNRYNGIAWSSNDSNFYIPYKVTKRATPSVTYAAYGEVYIGSWTSVTNMGSHGAGVRGVTVNVVKNASYTPKYGYFIRNQTIHIDAEL